MPSTYPVEAWASDGSIELLDGTTDLETGLSYVAKGVGPTSVPSYEVQYNRRLSRQNVILAPWRQLQVVDEGSLKIGVYPGVYTLGGARKSFGGATNQSVPDNATKYVYVDASNVLQIGDAEPADLTTFMPLAEVQTAGGVMTVVDRRLLGAFHVPQIEDSSDITGTPNATFQIDDDNTGPKLKNNAGVLEVRNEGDTDDANLKCGELDAVDQVKINGTQAINGSAEAVKLATGVAGTTAIAANAVTASKLEGVLQGRIPGCGIQAGSEASDKIGVTVQLEGAIGANLSEKRLVRVWIGDSAAGGETATAPNGGTSVQTGTLLKSITTDKHLQVITDANGTAVVELTDTGSPTFYLMVEFDSKIFSSSAITFA